MASHLLGSTSLGLLVASVLTAPVDWLKHSLLFHPAAKLERAPDAYGLRYREYRFGGPDAHTLHGWYFPGPGDALFIWFHGNAGNISHRLWQLRLLYDEVGGSHFLFDYQGYGNSRGTPSIAGILLDGRDALNLVHRHGWDRNKRVVFFGESLGCAVAVSLGTETPPDGVILVAPFYSLYEMGRIVMSPLAFLVADDLNTARLIPRLDAPTLFLHGTADDTIPYAQAEGLFALAQPPKSFHTVQGGGHGDLHETGGAAYYDAIRHFVSTTIAGADDRDPRPPATAPATPVW